MLAVAKITAKARPRSRGMFVLPCTSGPVLTAWEVGVDGTATVRRVQPMDIEYLRAIEGTLGEWAGAVDEEAYREL